MGICIFVNIRHNGHIFKVKKSFIYLLDLILGHPVYQFLHKHSDSLSVVLDSLGVTDFGNMCHYDGQLRILWQLLLGAMLREAIQKKRKYNSAVLEMLGFPGSWVPCSGSWVAYPGS